MVELSPTSAVYIVEMVQLLCGCPSINTLQAELFDIRSGNLVQGLTLMTSWTSLMVKVMGQRSRSSISKIILGVSLGFSVLKVISDIRMCKCFIYVCGQNFVHTHVQNRKICARAQIRAGNNTMGGAPACQGLLWISLVLRWLPP